MRKYILCIRHICTLNTFMSTYYTRIGLLMRSKVISKRKFRTIQCHQSGRRETKWLRLPKLLYFSLTTCFVSYKLTCYSKLSRIQQTKTTLGIYSQYAFCTRSVVCILYLVCSLTTGRPPYRYVFEV